LATTFQKYKTAFYPLWYFIICATLSALSASS
jgi:hypothetical protein